MHIVASLSPVADLPLAFLVERIRLACLADQWPVELRCGLPRKHFHLRFRCAAGALNRETGQAGLGIKGGELRLSPNTALYCVRFRFAAG